MDRTEATVRNMLAAIEAPLYDIGVLSDRGISHPEIGPDAMPVHGLLKVGGTSRRPFVMRVEGKLEDIGHLFER